MSLYLRKKTWWIQYTDRNGCRIQRSLGTQNKQHAQQLHDQLKAESWRIKELGVKPRYSWQETSERWINEQGHRKSLVDDLSYLKWLNTYLHDKCLDDINKTMIERLKAEKLNTGAGYSTVNHTLSFLRAVLNKAKNEWEWIDNIPTIKLLPVKNDRVRWLSHEEINRLLKQLPEHLQAMMRFTLATGLRQSNVTGLQWSQIDMTRKCAWVNANESKSGKAIALPLNSDAMAILRECEPIGTHVFTYHGKAVTRANNHAWRNALIRAGIEDFRWHDLRHCWASNHVMAGTPLNVLKELGGWSDLTMVLRYAHLSSEHLAQYAEKITTNGTNLLHTENK
ncbi:MAG: tyrosine-type recombinase/integrase [Methylococcales bacterium]